jgi:hypothetical protein
MPKRSEHDFAVNAFRIVEQAIGEHMNGAPLEAPEEKPATANRGHARAAKLTKERRSEIAKQGAAKRWKAQPGQ